MSRKLVYFDLNGISEFIRYLLHYGRLEFEDFRYDQKDWPSVKDSLPYGVLPIYEENGVTITQSMAIGRYVASQVGMLPSDPWEQAQLDAAVLNVYDFIKKLAEFYWEPDKERREKNKKALDEAIPFFMSRFEKGLTANNGHFGKKLSWADFVLVGTIELFNLYLSDTIEKDYPAITALIPEIHALPGVKEYVENRKPYSKPYLC